MRKLSIAIVLAVSSFASLAYAAPQDAVVPVPYAVDVQGKPVARTWMGVDQFKPYAGVYAMTNGKILKVWNEQNRFYARFDDEQAVQIFAVGSRDFVAKFGDLTLSFDKEDGHLRDDVVAYVPSTGARVASR